MAAAASALLLLMSIAACGTDSGQATTSLSSSTTAEVTTTTVAAVELAFDYFDAYAEQTDVGYSRMQDLSIPGSPAWDFYYHQQRVFTATNQAGGQSLPSDMTVAGDSIVFCLDAACAEGTHYSDFTFQRGKLYSFSVDGRNVGDVVASYATSTNRYCRWINDSGCGSDESVDIIIRSTYRAANNDLYVTFDWTRGAKATSQLLYDQITVNGQTQPSTYLEIDGAQILCNVWRVQVPDLGNTTVGYFGFPSPPVGSSVSLNIVVQWYGEAIFPFDLGLV